MTQNLTKYFRYVLAIKNAAKISSLTSLKFSKGWLVIQNTSIAKVDKYVSSLSKKQRRAIYFRKIIKLHER